MTQKPPIIGRQAPGGEPPARDEREAFCPVPSPPDLAGITVISLHPQPPLADYLAAMRLADAEAAAVPGYVDYDIHHGATLKVDVEGGRFVFFYRPVEF